MTVLLFSTKAERTGGPTKRDPAKGTKKKPVKGLKGGYYVIRHHRCTYEGREI